MQKCNSYDTRTTKRENGYNILYNHINKKQDA